MASPKGLRANRRVSSFLSRICRVGAVCAAIAAAVVLCAALSTAIVLPLWAFAMHCPRVYTAVCVAGMCAFIIIAIVRKHKSHSIKARETPNIK